MIQERSVSLELEQGPISKDLEVFYNPKMEGNRTLSIALLQAIEEEQLQIALPLASSGIRGLRMALELPENKIKSLSCNDMNPKAIAILKEAIKKYDVAIEVHQQDAQQFLLESKGFDYIDIDPFGSPNFLLESAIQRLSRRGILAVTATDTGALAGSFQNAGKMKYWAINHTNHAKHEIGLRILARKVMLMGMHQGKALTPVFSYHHQHYYRIFFRLEKSKQKAAKLFEQLQGYFHHNTVSGKVGDTGENCTSAGPCYTGSLQDHHLLEKMKGHLKTEELCQLIARVQEDNTIQTLGCYDTHQLAKYAKKQLPKLQEVTTKLREKGYLAARSAFHETSIKTTAPYEEIIACFTD